MGLRMRDNGFNRWGRQFAKLFRDNRVVLAAEQLVVPVSATPVGQPAERST